MINNLPWTYYLQLERDFLDTENYLAIDALNFKSYSLNYLQLLISIGSEIDIIFKELCKNINDKFVGKNIVEYILTIFGFCNGSLGQKQILLRSHKLVFSPWSGCIQKPPHSPDWWKIYNKIKHSRLGVEPNSGMEYYKFANQLNVLLALSALFSLHTCLSNCQHCLFCLQLDKLSDSTSPLKIEECSNIELCSELFRVYQGSLKYSSYKYTFI